jgi:hypothetical protein
VGALKLRDTLPPVAYDLFLKRLEAELANAEIDIPHYDRVARPDKAKLDMQARYGAIMRGLVNDIFRQRNLVKDGTSGRNTVRLSPKLGKMDVVPVRAQLPECNSKNSP